jgi:outer membrane receptor protein involved in Fe transport
VERGTNYEVGYEIADGKRTYSAMAFREDISNGVFLMSGDTNLAGAANLLPDLNTRGTVFNVGDYQRTGVQLAFRQFISDVLEFAAAAGRAEALISDSTGDAAGSLRSHIRRSPRPWATIQVKGSVPRTGTQLTTSYGWTDFRALMPIHQSLTGRTYQELGMNVRAIQPLPTMLGVRAELVAEWHNLLAQGYLTMRHKDGREAVLTNTPRQMRVGVGFMF